MANTTNYAWETPDDTDLVKDGAAAIRTLGSAIDTTTKALNPSTTLGDIEYRSSTANTNTRLAIGTTGQVLTVASGVPSWATPAAGGGGKLLQLVHATYSTPTNVASTTYTDTGLSATITPTVNTSKILIIVSQQAMSDRTGTSGCGIRILRDSTTIFSPAPARYEVQYSGAGGALAAMIPLNYLDTPATTSAITYKIQGATYATSSGGNTSFQENSSISQITLMEIGA